MCKENKLETIMALILFITSGLVFTESIFLGILVLLISIYLFLNSSGKPGDRYKILKFLAYSRIKYKSIKKYIFHLMN